jgi:signal transduction histidine kinase
VTSSRPAERLLRRLSGALAQEGRPNDIVRVALDALVSEMGAKAAAVFLDAPDSGEVRPVYSVNYPADVLDEIRAVGRSSPAISNLAMLTGEVQVMSLIGQEPDRAYTRQLGERIGVVTAAAVPLLASGRALGVLVYGLAYDHVFDAEELELLREVGDRIAEALERARLEDALRRRAEESELLQAIMTAAAGEDDLGRILSGTLDRLQGLLSFTGGSIALVEDDELVVRVANGAFADQAVGQRLPRGRGRTWQVIETGEPFFTNDLLADGFRSLTNTAGASLRSYIAVPLVWRGEPYGILEIDSFKPNAFRPGDLRLIRSIAIALSGPIELARRYAAEVRLREELDQAKGQLEAIFEHAPMGVFFIDTDRCLAYANRASHASLNLFAGQELVLHRPWHELAEVLARTRWDDTYERLVQITHETLALRSGILVHDYPLRNPRQLLKCIAAPVFQSGQFAGHVVLFIDVTAERDALAAAESAVRDRDRFMSITSHELRTPLTSIRGAAQFLGRIAQSDSLNHELLAHQIQTIDTQTDRLSELVNDLLDVARIRSGRLSLQPIDTDLAELAFQAVAALPEGERQRVRLDAPDSVPGCWDADRILQVIANLIDNALKYSDPTAQVDVTLRDQRDTAVMTVTDYGIGIPPADLEGLFDAFARAENAVEQDQSGLGLGLYICRQIVALHGGTIEVISTVGTGSTFTVRLPTEGHVGHGQSSAPSLFF